MTLGYLLFSAVLILVCRANVPRWWALLPIHLGLIGLICGLVAARLRQTPVLAGLSHWYPAMLSLFFFEEIGALVHAIHPGWFDSYLIAADYWLFGAHPTVWIERFSGYWMTEYMQLVYTSYFLLTLGFGLHLWLRGRGAAFATFIASTCAAYYICYVVFVLFPIESPHHTLAHLQQVALTGGPFTALINLIEEHGRVHGGAFPSAHVAGSVVVLLSAWRYAPRAARWLTPIVVSICVATIYGRYHYVMDVLAGIVVAGLGCWIGARFSSAPHAIWDKQGERIATEKTE